MKRLMIPLCVVSMALLHQNLHAQAYNIQDFDSKSLVLGNKDNMTYPKYWVKGGDRRKIQYFNVDQDSDEYQFIKSLFLPNKAFKAQRIQNSIVYRKYMNQKNALEDFYDEGKPLEQKFLFHGTRKTNPEQIYSDVNQSFSVLWAN